MTNSLPQTFDRLVVAAQLNAKPPLGLIFAIPDHPWYLSGDMAAVRIAMTVGVAGKYEGQLIRVVDSPKNAPPGGDELLPPTRGQILSNLAIGVDLDSARPLRSNEGLCSPGVKLHGSGFVVRQNARRNSDWARWLALRHTFDLTATAEILPVVRAV